MVDISSKMKEDSGRLRGNKKIYPSLNDYNDSSEYSINSEYRKCENDESDKTRSEETAIDWSYFLILFSIGALILGTLIYYFFPLYNSSTPKLLNKSTYNDNFQIWKKSSEEFMNNKDWNIVNKTVYFHIFGNPTKPAIINIIGHPDNSRQFHRQFTDFLIKTSISYDCPTLGRLDEQQHQDFVEFVNKTLSRKSKCIFVENIDTIKPALGPTLHLLTDDQNAIYKDVIFIFSISVNLRQYNSGIRADSIYMEALREAWTDVMGYERCEALLARLAVNVVAPRR